MKAPARPLLIWDGDCDFCRRWIALWKWMTGDAVDYAPYQEVAPEFPEVPTERFAAAVQLIEPDGTWSQGAEAVFRSLAYAPGRRWLIELYRNLPGFAAMSEWCYRQVARHRPVANFLTQAIWGAHLVPPGETRIAWVFLRLLGVVYAVAFISLAVQITGLVGSGGILPASEFLAAARQLRGASAYWLAPTLCWIASSDAFLHALCAAGVLLSLLLVAGLLPRIALIGLWIAYLSLATVARNFLWFQWDSLLLETGFLAIFLAPARLLSRPRHDPPPSRIALWLLRWLLFRLMFSSALVKLASGDSTWRDLTALSYHYETQPLPTFTAWYAHQLPLGFHRVSALIMFAIEGLMPFAIFAPRHIRFAAAGSFVALQIMIAATGNYAFFNLLTVTLCVLLLDDGVWARRDLTAPILMRRDRGRGLWPRGVVVIATAALVLVSAVPLVRTLRWPTPWLEPAVRLYRWVSPLRLVNPYGLFAIMTVRRPEIIVEASSDGERWEPYEFRHKPGDLNRRPEFVAPHQPRLDWQMWFAALRDFQAEPWFLPFCERLLQGSPSVLALLARNPFPEGPPRFVRAWLYDYRFTDVATRRESGAWWRRERLGLYCPALTLDQGRLRLAREIGGDESRAP